jgi:hypothetical protein
MLGAMAAYAHDPQVIEQARIWQAREAVDPAAVDPTLAPVVVGATAQFGDATTYERFLEVYQQRKQGSYTPQQADYYALALARFQQSDLVARTLQLLEEFTFPFNTLGGMLFTLFTQPRTQVATWEWLKRNWANIEERAPMFVVPAVETSGTLPAALRADVAAFWEANLHGEYAGAVARALEQIDHNADVQTRTHDDLLAYFTSRAPVVGAPAAVQPDGVDLTPASAPSATGAAPITAAQPSTAALSTAVSSSTLPSADPAAAKPATPAPQAPRSRGGWLRRLFRSR